MSRAKYSHYAVRVGKVPGIYLTWDECDEQVHGYPFASFKGFKSLEEAVEWMNKAPSSSRGNGGEKSAEKLSPHLRKLGIGASRVNAYQTPLESTQQASSSWSGASGGNVKCKTGVVIGTEMDG
ncbi:hypothetical protein PIB30_052881, partial [Stylosanthes scabra]|nr:hypothetical protein [Stylosanthes scabra]